jgi:branched-chain amino acid transport system substrate-binding protein
MNKTGFQPTRRTALKGAAAAGALLAAPALVRAQGAAPKLATLTPLTGAGGSYGPSMRKSAVAVVEAVNAAGGLLGQEITVVSGDTQTNPEAAVRAARKLIDVDQAMAIVGTWASGCTTAVAPLCWESKTMLACVSGADSITKLPHQGYIIRTQPVAALQITAVTQFILAEGAKKLAWIGPQTPFAQPSIDIMTKVAGEKGKPVAGLIYEADKTTYRSEVDKILREKPDYLMLGGYTPDSIVVLRDLYRASYDGVILGPAYAVNRKLLDALPHEVTQGVRTYAPSPDINSSAYKRVQEIHDTSDVDPYTTQVYDHANLMLLAAAAAGKAQGTAMRDAMRSVSQGEGEAVDNAVDGMKILAGGGKVNYAGASGPCDFDKIGDISSATFRFNKVNKGKFELMKIV